MTGLLASGSATTGALRDGLSVLGNLSQILGSRNVGPKAIAGALPSVLGEVQVLDDTVLALWQQLLPGADTPEAAQIREFALGLTERLGKDLSAAARERRLTAGARLRLERGVREAERGLAAVLLLFEIVEARAKPATRVDLRELITFGRLGDYPGGPHSREVAVTLLPGPTLALPTDPRSALGLVGLTAACVLAGEPDVDGVILLAETANRVKMARQRTPSPNSTSVLVAAPSSRICWQCLVVAAGAYQIESEKTEDGVSLTWAA